MEFLTVDDYKRINNLQKPGLESDIVAYINAANSFVTKWLNFSEDSGYLEVLANRQKYFFNPMTSDITVTTLDGRELSNYLYLGDGVLYFQVIPPAGMYKVITTEGSFGTEVPDDLKQAVAMLVDHWNKKEYLESRSFGGENIQSVTKTTGIPTHIRSILELYRNY